MDMKTLKEIGFLQTGMILVDYKGNEGAITGITRIEGFGYGVEFDNEKDRMQMWDWNRLRDDVYVKDGTYKE